jgi:hypothetical protein
VGSEASDTILGGALAGVFADDADDISSDCEHVSRRRPPMGP